MDPVLAAFVVFVGVLLLLLVSAKKTIEAVNSVIGSEVVRREKDTVYRRAGTKEKGIWYEVEC